MSYIIVFSLSKDSLPSNPYDNFRLTAKESAFWGIRLLVQLSSTIEEEVEVEEQEGDTVSVLDLFLSD